MMTNSDADTELQAAVQDLVAAELRGDVPSLERLVAVDYEGFDPRGNPQGREALLAPYRAGTMKVEQLTRTQLHFRRFGDVGLVTGRTILRGHAEGKSFDHKLRFLDVFLYRDAHWQLVASHVATLQSAAP
jgi:ketosteroid isomerase-like protein